MANIHIKTAYDYIRRSPFQAFAAIFVLSLTFFVTTFLVVLVYSSDQLLTYFETRPRVIAFLSNDATDETVAVLKDKLSQDENIKSVEYRSKENALGFYKEATKDNPLLGELVSPTIFPASLEISLNSLSDVELTIETLKSEEVVDQVGFTGSLRGGGEVDLVISRLKNLTNFVRVGGGFFVTVLLTTSFLVLMVIVSMRMSSRKGEIEILNLIGATPGFIRSPILLEALTYSFIGVFLGWISAFILVVYATPSILQFFGNVPVLPKSAGNLAGLFGAILLVELLVGMLLAIVGALLAVAKVKK